MKRAAILAAVLMLQAQEQPPSITYGSSRESKAWIRKPDGVSVAVDDGITWKGVTVYLSLTDDLVAVDAATKETLWAKSVGAFWSRVTFVEAGDKSWAVELRPGPRETEGKDLVQRHDLKTGEVLKDPKDKPPSGTQVKPRHSWSGAESRVAKGFAAAVTTRENFEKLRERLLGGTPGEDIGKHHKLDFAKEFVLVVSEGRSANCDGIHIESAWRDEKRLLVRLTHRTFQTIGDGVPTRPWGVFILPRQDGEVVVLEENTQPYIGGPPIWKETRRFERAKDPAKELEGIPDPEPPRARDKAALTWNPPAGSVFVAKVKGSISTGKKSEGAFECESELHRTETTVKTGRVFTVRVNRLHATGRERGQESEILFERGKETVLKGGALEDPEAYKAIGDDHSVVVDSLGRRESDPFKDHIVQTMSLGIVGIQFAADAVGVGSTWQSDARVPFPGHDFNGKLTCTVEALEKGKSAKVAITVLEEDGWEGAGSLVYSFEESIVRDFTFALKRKDRDGRTTVSFEQTVTLILKR